MTFRVIQQGERRRAVKVFETAEDALQRLVSFGGTFRQSGVRGRRLSSPIPRLRAVPPFDSRRA